MHALSDLITATQPLRNEAVAAAASGAPSVRGLPGLLQQEAFVQELSVQLQALKRQLTATPPGTHTPEPCLQGEASSSLKAGGLTGASGGGTGPDSSLHADGQGTSAGR